ncbi:ABC transporter substrate-binding protein [Vibrio viridaestus]|uniref:ABC transporter substrate-binding protein n=1 Tax=Vibrio viridaestus TaxID=2487322 RepID=A0A3N9U1P8_9VIBR|nr:ABC transporter substrate-binding protein [Vibrio viridaestus]RQW61846.1 ABC transporter substrate-binding protein [Vibrio viridaestus]
MRSLDLLKIAVPVVAVVGVVSLYINVFGQKPIIETTTPLSSFRIAVSQTPLSAPILIAQYLNLFKENNLNVKLVPCFGGVDCAERMFDAQADFATSSESVVMFDSFKRNNFSILTTFVNSDNDLKLLSISNIGVNSVQDLIGKRVGVVKASSSEFYLYSLLLVNGIDPKQVNKVYLKPEDLAPELYSYGVDAISVWEPYGYQTELKASAPIVNIGTQGIYHLTFNLISMNEYIHANESSVRTLIRTLDQAVNWINNNPVKAKNIIAEMLQLNYAQLSWSWDDYVFRLSLSNSLLSNLQLQARWAKESGLVNGEIPDYRQFLATDINLEPDGLVVE